MPKPPGHSDFIFEEKVPKATLVSDEASAWSSKWILRATFFMLFVLGMLCLIGPHIPGGE